MIVKVAPLLVPPPGLGLYTVKVAVPAEAISAAGTWAVNAVVRPPPLTTGVVVRLTPFHRTTELWSNVLPLTVSVKADPPAVALLGDRD